RFLQDFSERLDGSQANAQAGERAGARGYGESADILPGESVLREQCGNLRDELGGEGSAGQGDDFENLQAGGAIRRGVRHAPQGDAAVLSGGVGGEKDHGSTRFLVSQRNARPPSTARRAGSRLRWASPHFARDDRHLETEILERPTLRPARARTPARQPAGRRRY